jgi:hypothetical protein
MSVPDGTTHSSFTTKRGALMSEDYSSALLNQALYMIDSCFHMLLRLY